MAFRVTGAVLLLIAGCATPPSTTLRDSYQVTKTGLVDTTNHSTVLELGSQDKVGVGGEYRIGERFIRSARSNDNDGSTSDELSTLNQPSIDLSVEYGALAWLQGFEMFRTRTQSSSASGNLVERTDILEKVEWTPVDLPQVTTWLDYRTDRDSYLTDREDTEFVFEVTDTRGPASYSYSLELEEITDAASDTRDSRVEHTARGTYQDSFLDGKLSASASALVDERRSTSRVPAVSATSVEVLLEEGYGALDTTPEISTLPPIPGLVDEDRDTPLGINIGGFASGGETNWNMGARLPVGETANLAYLYTAEEVDTFLVNQFSFSVWQSDDNNFWDLVAGSPAFTYERTLQRFRIVFPQVEARYMKVVNTASPPTAPAVLVTEIELFHPGLGGGGGGGQDSLVDKISTRSVNGGLSFRPLEKVTLTYDIFAQQTSRETGGVTTREESQIDNGLVMVWIPSPVIDVSLRGGLQAVRDSFRPTQVASMWNGFVGYRPLDTLDVALSYTGTRREEGGALAFATSGAQARASAQLLEKLSTDFTVETSTQEDHANLRDIDRFGYSASMIAALTRSFDVTLGYRNEEGKVTGPGAGDIPDPSEKQAELLLLYQPTDQLTTEVRLEWKDSYSGRGVDQRYRVDWIPFTDGALDLQFDVDHTEGGVQSTAGFDRYLMISRWNMNPKAYFELDYSALLPDEGANVQTATISFNLVM